MAVAADAIEVREKPRRRLMCLCSMHVSAPKSALVTPIAIRIARSAATCPCIGPLRRKSRYSWTRAWIPRSEATA